ncbi:type II secretion system protein [Nocardioides sp. SYSU DS0651]|uniref:type II secretion system protein n=1 Tax=Nocardioides sp. SYSU DS0651 TaxID=3415955 RepID=UPI003F4B3E29
MRLIGDRLRRIRSDDGFTLVEMIVTVAILGVISAALFGVVLQYLRTTNDTRARLSESTDQQFISTYWQSDVSSLGRRSLSAGSFTVSQSVFVGTAGPGGCGDGVGAVVVAFAWDEFPAAVTAPADAWHSEPHEVAYVLRAGTEGRVLQRVRCRNGVADAPHTVAHHLAGAPVVSCDTSCTAASPPNRVSMRFTVRDADNPDSPGYQTTVTADRRQG